MMRWELRHRAGLKKETQHDEWWIRYWTRFDTAQPSPYKFPDPRNLQPRLRPSPRNQSERQPLRKRIHRHGVSSRCGGGLLLLLLGVPPRPTNLSPRPCRCRRYVHLPYPFSRSRDCGRRSFGSDRWLRPFLDLSRQILGCDLVLDSVCSWWIYVA